jgi:competence ComEA-like helix-hairpin-helix protein
MRIADWKNRAFRFLQSAFCIPHFTIACALLLATTACVKLPRQYKIVGGQTAPLASQTNNAALVNLNAATAEDLERLPGIGKALAARIIAYRNQYGRFRRPEHLMMVRGISDRRFRNLAAFVTAD